MIPKLLNLDGYIEVDGKQLRTPLQQIEKNKDDIKNNQDAIIELGKNMIILPAAPENPMILAIDSEGNLFLREYSNKAIGNSIVQRTGGGGAKFISQYGAADAVANITMLEIAQTMNYVDSFTKEIPSYPYKPYALAAKGWGATISLPEGTITDLPQDPSSEWYQKVVNAHDNPKTVILKNGVQFNGTTYRQLNQCVSLYTDKATHADSAIAYHPAGREDLRIIIAPHSTINIRCRNRPSGYTQIWIT